MGKCVIIQTKYGPRRIQASKDVRQLKPKDIKKLESLMEFIEQNKEALFKKADELPF